MKEGTMRIRRMLQPLVRRLEQAGWVVAVIGGLAVWACARHDASTLESSSPVIRSRAVKAARVESPVEVEVYGTVESNRTAAISTRVMAMVTSVEVRAGDRVSRGQALLEIDPQAAHGRLAQARGALVQARAALTLAARNHERFEALAATEAASQLELDTARMHHEQAKGAVEQAEGAVDAASAVAADAHVIAPFDGRIVRRMVEVGDLAAPGRPLLTVESEKGRRLAIEVKVRVEIDTRFDLDGLEAEVVEVAPGVDPMSHTLSVKIELPVEGIASGSSGRAWIPTGKRSVVAVPFEALLERGGLTLVVLATAEGRTATRVVTTGQRLPAAATGGELVEVLSGLSGGETLLVALAGPPAAGTQVEIVR
jgi:RND family efflux transporter MFP subunit